MLFSLKLTPKFPDIHFRFRPDFSSGVRSNPTKYYDILCCLTGCDVRYVYMKGLFAYLPKQWPDRAPWHYHSRQKVCACALMKTCYNRNGGPQPRDSIIHVTTWIVFRRILWPKQSGCWKIRMDGRPESQPLKGTTLRTRVQSTNGFIPINTFTSREVGCACRATTNAHSFTKSSGADEESQLRIFNTFTQRIRQLRFGIRFTADTQRNFTATAKVNGWTDGWVHFRFTRTRNARSNLTKFHRQFPSVTHTNSSEP